MPIPALFVPKSVVMIAVPIAGGLAIAIVEAVVIVVIAVLRTLIVMIAIIMILRLSQRYAEK